jgi:hypothetical protein
MTPDDLQRWMPILVSLATFGFTIYVFRRGIRRDELGALSARIDMVEAKAASRIEAIEVKAETDRVAGESSRADVRIKLSAIEAQLSQAPDKDSVHRLALDVSEIRGDLKAQVEAMKGVTASNARIEQFLLKVTTKE